MKSSNHLGQSLSLAGLLLVVSIGIIGLMTLQSGGLQ
jgi:hypothetical protein